MGLGSDQAVGLDSYGNFPSFDGSGTRDSGFFSRRYSVSNGWSTLGGGMGLSLQGVNRYGSFDALHTEGAQFGYTFKNAVTLYGGFDTLKYDSRIGSPFAAFESTSDTLPVYSMHGGIEFKPASNVSLSLGFSYAGQQSGLVDSDINSPALPGATPSAFTSGRR